MFACVCCLLLLLGELMTLLGLTVWQYILWHRGSYKLAEHDGASFIYRGQHDIATFAGKTRDHVVSQEKWWTNAVLQHNTQEPSADSFRHPENDPDRQHIQSQWEGRGSQLRKAKKLRSDTWWLLDKLKICVSYSRAPGYAHRWLYERWKNTYDLFASTSKWIASVSRSHSSLGLSSATLALGDRKVFTVWAAQKIRKPSQFWSSKWSPAQAFWFYILIRNWNVKHWNFKRKVFLFSKTTEQLCRKHNCQQKNYIESPLDVGLSREPPS